MDNIYGQLILLTGVSGSGKSFLMRNLKNKGFVESISHTTRKPRLGEINGKHFYFVNKEEFKLIDFIETDEWANNFYGTSRDEIESKLKNNKYVFAIVNEAGCKNLKKIYKDRVKKIFISITRKTMIERLNTRLEQGKITENDISVRLKEAFNNNEFLGFSKADLVLDGTNLNNIDILLKYLNTYNKNEEIERKFIVNEPLYYKELVKCNPICVFQINQYYDILNNEIKRFRSKYNNITKEYTYKKEIKSQNIGLKRIEKGWDLTKEEFLKAINNLDLFIEKYRTIFEFNQDGNIYISEVDNFKDKNFKHIIAEFEFFNEEQANKFKKPIWCEKEVTNDNCSGSIS